MKLKFLFAFIIFFASCGQLQFDTSVAFPLATVSVSPTPAQEDIRSFVQYGDVVYAAAGSGGILAYRIVGETMNPILSLSLTNLYSEGLEQVYVRTVEIVETPNTTNLIYAYDTLSGGGIGVVDISPGETRPLGSLKIAPNVRIKSTSTTYNPQGVYHVLAAQENVGIVSYEISFISNSYFELPAIASLVDFIAQTDLERPAQQFMSLSAPEASRITNIAQITNADTLVQLALDNPELFSSVISNLPFIPEQQRAQIQQLLTLSNQRLISQVISNAQDAVGEDVVNQVLANPGSLNNLLNNSALAGALSQVLNNTELSNVDNINQIQSNISPELVAQTEKLIQDTNNTASSGSNSMQDVLSISSLQQIIQNALTVRGLDDVDDMSTNTNTETQTLFEESMLSNLNLAESIDTDLVNNTNYNPFENRTPVGNARAEIQRTVSAVGRTFFVEENEDLKNRLLALTDAELRSLFTSLFAQADTAISLIPLFETSGINVRELYQLWLQGDYAGIINSVDPSVIAELLRRLPRYQTETIMNIVATNISIPNIQDMSTDLENIYVAAGSDGALVVDRLTWNVSSSIKKPFSDVTALRPYQWNNKKYYIITDKLDGLILYRRLDNKSLGEQVTRMSLVGEGLGVYPYQDIFWVADGSNGILSVRLNNDESLTIEAELYQKSGIAYYIGAARRREVIASYGADGLRRLRVTNVIENLPTTEATIADAAEPQEDNTGDFIDRMILWSRNSSIAQFFRRIFFLI